MKKLTVFLLILSLVFVWGCVDIQPTAEPTANPSITYTKGRFIDTNPPTMEGLITEVTDDTITIKIEDTDYKLTLSERAKEEIEIYRDKHDLHVQKGAFMQIKYDQEGDEYIAKNLLFLESNFYVG